MTVQRPAPSTPREFHFPAFERDTLQNGMGLVVAPMHRLPVVTAILVIAGGAATESEGMEGVSDIVARVLSEGTEQKSADELVMALERLGTSVSASADWESTILKMTVLSPRLPAALSLMSEMVTSPRFENASIERLREERLSEIIQTRSEPRVLADEVFSATLYDQMSRYAVPVGGSATSVAGITEKDVRQYHTANYQPQAATLILAGDIDAEQAEKAASAAFCDWQKRSAAPATRVLSARGGDQKVRLVDRTGAQQSELRMGHIAVPRSVPEYFSIVVMNAVLGGLFSSRINLNLREVHGYTYGASSYFDWRKDKGPFVISSAVQSDVTGAAITEILKEIDKIRETEIANDELTLATSYLAGVFPIRYETADAVASGLASLVIFDLPEQYFTSYRDNILSVTSKDVRAAAESFLHPEQLKIVVAGNPSLVEPQLRSLGSGEVSVLAGES
jgi:zinc protease